MIALLMGVFFILNTLLMSVNERIREIGILAALGWRKMRIMAMVMFEGMLLAALGSAAGLLIGIAGLHRLASLKHLQGFIDPAVSFVSWWKWLWRPPFWVFWEAFIRHGGLHAFGLQMP